jgi:hypothetical protein
VRYFAELGRAVEARWRRAGFDQPALPAIAEAALLEMPPGPELTPVAIARSLLSQESLPPQQLVSASFGQPPVTVWRGRRCFVDVYFWLDGTTAIHQHGFAGAFHVLAGSSIHGTYRFRETRRISAAMLLGRLELEAMQLLPAGATRRIVPHGALIHSLFHLERPSVTLVVRDPGTTQNPPSYEYRKPGLAIDPFHEDVTTVKALQLLGMLHRIDAPDLDTVAGELIERSDAHTAYLVLRECLAHRDLRLERIDALLDHAARAHGDAVVEELAAVLEEDSRQERLARLRRLVHDPEGRFMLAVLRNAPGRDTALRLIAERRPDAEPLLAIDRFIDRLGELGIDDPDLLEPLLRAG